MVHSIKFLPSKAGSLLTKISHLLVNFLELVFRKRSISRFQFFPDFVPPPAKADAWGQRERPLTF